MAAPRRATESTDVIVAERDSSPRRGTLRVPLLRSLIAPIALSGALVAAWAGGVGMEQPRMEAFADTPETTHTVGVSDLSRAAELGASRSQTREPLPQADVQEMPDVSVSPTPTAESTPTEEPTPSAEPEPTPTPTPTPEPEPTPDYSTLGEDAGPNWTKASVNVRTGPGTGFEVVSSYASGAKVTTTSLTEGNWQQVNMRGNAGWINQRFLSDSAPASSPASTPASSSSASSSSSSSSGGGSSSSGGSSTAQCSRAASVEAGLTSNTKNVLRAACNRFTDINNFGGRRSGGGSYHSSGRAIDVMVSGERGWEVARWARDNASQLGIIEVIYAQKIWTTQRAGEGWRSMSDRGSASANHYDHVHISVR